MNKKCLGCGLLLQYENPSMEGYTPKTDSIYCQRCFKLINYGTFNKIDNKETYFLDIFENVTKTNDLILFLVDIFNISNALDLINKYINNKIILVLTKRDILPKSVKDDKIKKYIINKCNKKNIIETIIISSNTNYNFDELYDLILKNKNSNNVYVIGNTNAGKSTFINKMIKNYSEKNILLTTSIYPSTTLELNEIQINENLTLIDTPGLIDKNNINNYVSKTLLKRITPKKEIKPYTFQLEEGAALYAENLFRMEYVKGNKNSFTIYISNDIIISRINIVSNHRGKEFIKTTLNVKKGQDIVINGLCFIKIVNDAVINIYALKGVKVSVRDSLI